MGADLRLEWMRNKDIGKYDWSEADVGRLNIKTVKGLVGGTGSFPNKEWMVDTLLDRIKVPVLKPFNEMDCRTVYLIGYEDSVRFVNEIKRLAVLSIEREDRKAKKELNSIFGKDYCKFYEHVPEDMCFLLVEAKIIRDVLASRKNCSCIAEVWY